MSPALIEAWPQIQHALRRENPGLRESFKALLELRAAPVLKIARITGQAPDAILTQFQELEQMKLVEGVQKDDPFEAYYRITPTALAFQQYLWALLA